MEEIKIRKISILLLGLSEWLMAMWMLLVCYRQENLQYLELFDAIWISDDKPLTNKKSKQM